MSVIAHRKNAEIPATAGEADRAAIASLMPAIAGFLRKAIVGSVKFFVTHASRIRSADAHRRKIEV